MSDVCGTAAMVASAPALRRPGRGGARGRGRPVLEGAALSVLALWLACPAAVLAADPMGLDRTAPGQMRGLGLPLPPLETHPPRTLFTHSRVVYRLPDGIRIFATFDRTLSHLCQRGAFIQRTAGFYWATTPDKGYGVAFSGGANLDDPQNRRQPGKVYFFDGQDSRCGVFVGDQLKLKAYHTGS